MPIRFYHRGNLNNINKFLERCLEIANSGKLDKYGREGVAILAAMTPERTGKTASSWEYKIERDEKGVSIVWYNTNMNEGYSIALLLQYGHAVWNAGQITSSTAVTTGEYKGSLTANYYVRGIDYINPAMRPLFNKIVKEIDAEV